MASIAGHTKADHLGIDPGTTFFGMFIIFQDEYPGPFAKDKAIPITIKRPRSPLRLIITGT